MVAEGWRSYLAAESGDEAEEAVGSSNGLRERGV